MRLIDADALLEKMKKTDRYFNIVFDIEDAPTVDAVSIDDYRSMENTCYKLQRVLYEMADRFIEDAPIVHERKTEGMKIGDEVYIHGYIDEIRPGTIIIRNDGGYFGTIKDEIKTREELNDENKENREA